MTFYQIGLFFYSGGNTFPVALLIISDNLTQPLADGRTDHKASHATKKQTVTWFLVVEAQVYHRVVRDMATL